MRVASSLVGALIGALAVMPAAAGVISPHHGGASPNPTPPACDPSFPNDGCAGAPAPSTAAFWQPNAFQPGNLINTVSGSPTHYMASDCGGSGSSGACRPPWKVAGVDYAIGYYSQNCPTNASTTWSSPSSCLLDPAVLSAASLLPAGCTYSPTSNNGGPHLTCNSGWQGTLQHMNFGPINGHGCTQVQVNLVSSSPILIDDFNFQNDSGLCGNSQGFALVISGNPLPAITPIISNFVMDGNNSTFSTVYGAASCISSLTRCNPRAAIFSDAVVIKYGAIENFAANPVNVAAAPAPTGSTLIEYSVIESWNNRSPNNHTEWFAGPNAGSVASTEIQYTLSIAATNNSTFGPTPMFTSSGWPVSFGAVTLQNNTVINQWSGGLTTPRSAYRGCRGATFTGGVCSGAGAKFFLISGQAGWGNTLQGCGVNGVLGPPVPGSPPPGATAVFWIDGFGNFTGYGDLGQNDQAAAACSGTLGAHATGDTGFMFGYGPHPAASINIANNYIDASSWGSATPPLYMLGQIPRKTTATFTSTTSMTTSARLGTVIAGEYISGPGLCPGDLTTCPFVSTTGAYGAGSTVPINPNGTTPSGTRSATVGQATVCTTRPTFSGNIDMSGRASSAYMNAWTGIRSNVGCL